MKRATAATETRGRWPRRLGCLALALVSVMVPSVFGLRWFARTMIFPRNMVREQPEVISTPGLSQHWIDTDEGRVEYWFLAGRGVSDARPGPAVFFAHGNAEVIDNWAEPLAPYRALGVSVVLPEFRGYGRSAGSPSEDAIRSDFRAVYEQVVARSDVDASRVVYHGRSLGGGAVCSLSAHAAPRAMVLESTFTSLTDVASAMRVPAFLLPDRFDNRTVVRSYSGPLLVFHGRRDGVIPFEHGQELQRVHPADTTFVPYSCGHNDLPPPGSDYWPRIEQFLRTSGVVVGSEEAG